MANYEYAENEEDSPILRRPPKSKQQANNAMCNSRLEELAQPKRWPLLATYKCHAHLLDPKRMQAIKERIQEAFSMSPEETELYFNTLREKKPKKIDYKMLRLKAKREKANARRAAYKLFKKLLKKAMIYATNNAPPLLVTPVLRIMSDHILQILCNVHKTKVPQRSDSDNLAHFLISVADWTAIFVANIYYEIEVADRNEIAENERLNRVKSLTETQKSETELQTGVTDYQEDEAELQSDYQTTNNEAEIEGATDVSEIENTEEA